MMIILENLKRVGLIFWVKIDLVQLLVSTYPCQFIGLFKLFNLQNFFGNLILIY